jgi:hypothetical protein
MMAVKWDVTIDVQLVVKMAAAKDAMMVAYKVVMMAATLAEQTGAAGSAAVKVVKMVAA